MKYLIVVGGPTASGKTALAIELARHYNTEIISGDSRQFYREMRIGNARPSEEELAAVPHHFVADRSVMEPLTAGRFAEKALGLLEMLFQKYETAILVGGSGLYLRALCEGLDEFPPVTEGAGSRVEQLYGRQGLQGLQRELERLDPTYFAIVDRQNPRRLERALKVCYSSGQPYSSFLGQRQKRSFIPIYLKLDPDRAALYERIDRRVETMIDLGLREEARSLQSYRELPALQTVGYQEWWPHFDGAYDETRTVELIQRNSRRYAKRQITWFRDYLSVDSPASAIKAFEAAKRES